LLKGRLRSELAGRARSNPSGPFVALEGFDSFDTRRHGRERLSRKAVVGKKMAVSRPEVAHPRKHVASSSVHTRHGDLHRADDARSRTESHDRASEKI
jgi:hypothetical protein